MKEPTLLNKATFNISKEVPIGFFIAGTLVGASRHFVQGGPNLFKSTLKGGLSEAL